MEAQMSNATKIRQKDQKNRPQKKEDYPQP